MKRSVSAQVFTALAVIFSIFFVQIGALAQTQVKIPKNKYKVADDLKIGRESSAEVEKIFPLINDADSVRYIQSVGQRLASGVPNGYRQPEMTCGFKIVNASDINAFALPGCFLYVNRGMIEAAKNEGEMAGVMAHEISHAMLRHGTAQATKQGSFGTQLGIIGAVIGGAILGGEAGAQLGMLGAQAYLTKYSREYESGADILGSQILANSGYDPIDLANMFKTIQAQGGGGAPEWLSSHPDPGKRYETIAREAKSLRVSPNPIKITRDFERIKAKMAALPKAKTMAELEKAAQGNGGGTTENPGAGGVYSKNVPAPSASFKTEQPGNWLQIKVPSNWKSLGGSQTSIEWAPEGAYGDQGITHGLMVGVTTVNAKDLQSATEEYINGVLQGNSYLSKQTAYAKRTMSGRNSLAILLAGKSPVTGRTENVTIYTAMLSNGSLFYFAAVSPQDQAQAYNSTFSNIFKSIVIRD